MPCALPSTRPRSHRFIGLSVYRFNAMNNKAISVFGSMIQPTDHGLETVQHCVPDLTAAIGVAFLVAVVTFYYSHSGLWRGRHYVAGEGWRRPRDVFLAWALSFPRERIPRRSAAPIAPYTALFLNPACHLRRRLHLE